MQTSKDLGKDIGQFYATEAAECKAAAHVERPKIMDSAPPDNPASVARWQEEKATAEDGYTDALLHKDPATLTATEKTHLGRVLVQALKELQ